MSSIRMEDYTEKVLDLVQRVSADNFLETLGAEVEAQAARNTPVDTGQLKKSWTHRVDRDNLTVTIGNGMERAIWLERGTGEYAINGDGRRGGWVYTDSSGETHFTRGTRPRMMLDSAVQIIKGRFYEIARKEFGGLK